MVLHEGRRMCSGGTMLVHTVFFYLRPELAAAERAVFAEEVARLGTIATVRRFHAGRPAPVPPRPVIDLSFDWSITCIFDDVAGHDAYQIDPVHLRFIERCREMWTRVQVYDALGGSD